MTPLYERFVVGWPLILFTFGMAVFLAVMLTVEEAESPAVWFSLAMLAVPLVMGFMKIAVHVGELRIRFLLGVPRATIDLAEVDSMRVTRSWRETGFGLSVKPLQGRFCLTGRSAVVLLMKNGRTYVVGAPEPEKLLKALNRARDRYAGRS